MEGGGEGAEGGGEGRAKVIVKIRGFEERIYIEESMEVSEPR